MIKVNNDKTVQLELDGVDYSIDNEDSYRDLLIILTDPNPDVQFSDNLFDVDSEITDPELAAIADRYSGFFKEYLLRRAQKIEERKGKIEDGFAACEDSVKHVLFKEKGIYEW